MKKLLLITTIGFLNIMSFAQTPNWLWAKSAGGTNVDCPHSIAVDASGNIYVVGYFASPTIIFGSITLTNTATYGSADIFLAKYDAIGNVLWVKSIGGMGNDEAYSISVDASENTYVAGKFESSTIIFGSTTLTNATTNGSADIFLAKYDANGNVIWAKSAGGTSNDRAYSISVDASENTYVAGYFASSTITFGSTTLINASLNYSDIFFAKYDANGNVTWAKSGGGQYSDIVNSIMSDVSGNTYLAGWFDSPTLSFESTSLSNMGGGYPDIFLAKCDNLGIVLWAKSAGGLKDDRATSVAIDAIGNTYVVGYFKSSTIIFGSTTLTNATTIGSADIFLAKYDTNGNVLWAKSVGGIGDDEAYSVTMDASGNIYVVGYFGSSTIILGSTTLTNIIANGSEDILLAKYDANGNVIWAKSVGGTGDDEAYSIAIDASENTYVSGMFSSDTISFGSTTLPGNEDIFLAKLGSSTVINELSDSLNFSVFPIPATNSLTIESPQKSKIEILNIQGQLIKTIAAINDQTTIDISVFPSGIYFIKVKTEKGIAVKKFIKE